jgi:S-adenosylmethionine hydrolase
MKGVIYKINPEVRIADITHMISPQNILEGAIALSRSYRYFPPGTIHVAVVDPGVGTHRRPVAAQIGEYLFVGPDNGLFSMTVQEAQESGAPVSFVHLDRPAFWLPAPSHVFHGRDIFAPTAAHLAKGIPLLELGTPVTDPVVFAAMAPQPMVDGWGGEVIAVDHFGNLSTNILESHLAGMLDITVHIKNVSIAGLVKTFGERPPGDLIALIGTDKDLSISIVNGSAQDRLGVGIGEKVFVTGKRT